MTEKSRPLSTTSREGAYVMVATVVTLGAMSFTGFTGHGLLQVPEIVETGPEADAVLRTGAQCAPLWAVLELVVREMLLR